MTCYRKSSRSLDTRYTIRRRSWQGRLCPSAASMSKRSPSSCQGKKAIKRPAGLTLIPRQRGKSLTWASDASSEAHTLADSWSPMLRLAQVLQQLIRPPVKISSIQPFGQDTCHLFQPIAAQTHVGRRFQWVFYRFLFGARDRICLRRQSRAQFSLSARISITTQRFRSILLRNCFSEDDDRLLQLFALTLVFNHRQQ